MGAVNRRRGSRRSAELDGRRRAALAPPRKLAAVQLQAQTRQVQPAPQVETAEAVACW